MTHAQAFAQFVVIVIGLMVVAYVIGAVRRLWSNPRRYLRHALGQLIRMGLATAGLVCIIVYGTSVLGWLIGVPMMVVGFVGQLVADRNYEQNTE